MPTCSTRAMAPQPVRPEGARPPRLSTLHVGPPVGNHRTIRGSDTNPRRSVRHHQRYGGIHLGRAAPSFRDLACGKHSTPALV